MRLNSEKILKNDPDPGNLLEDVSVSNTIKTRLEDVSGHGERVG